MISLKLDYIMPFQFPDLREIHLKKPPLKEVVCQVRFNPILRITHEPPTGFQDRVRERFPEYTSDTQVLFPGVSGGSPTESDINQVVTHRFSNRTTGYRASLGTDFVSLDTKQYKTWQDFLDNLLWLTDLVNEFYRVASAIRIGLRYINVIDPTIADEAQVHDVLDLVRAELIAGLRTNPLQGTSLMQQRYILVEGETTLSLRLAVGEVDEIVGRSSILDYDCYCELAEIPMVELQDRLMGFHDIIYRAFRWSLSEHQDIAPFEPVEEQ